MLYRKELNNHTSKHIDPKFHLTMKFMRNNAFAINYCSTENMVADALTKPSGKAQHWELTKLLLNYRE